jgi:LuxR family maltose regulon positive regulatory protein
MQRAGPGVLVETKLYAPRGRREWVSRDELAGQLAGTAGRLLLVEAPAGFGKTTLIAQWRLSAAESRPFAWVSLDRGDNDPGRLWWHVAGALLSTCPGLSTGNVLAAVRDQRPDSAGALLPLLVNELAQLPEPVVLVLDDYHVISERDCHDQLAFLLLHLPPTVQLVLITRVEPPLPLARLRAAGEMAEVRAADLRFAPAHAAELVATVAGLELSRTDLAELVDLTEGWPAGIYLAALSLRGHASPSAIIRQFRGDSRFVGDFLAEEVLSHQPDTVRRFLARTSILSRFCAPLCDAVTGSGDAAEIIDLIERQNLFVVPLDDARRWFRYHHLFGQMLRSELRRSEPGMVPTLHERASAWHRRSGATDEAISHAYAAGDIAGVINLIAERWYAYVASGQVATVRGWLSLLGDDIVGTDPVAVHCAAWVAALSGDQASLRRWLPIVEASGFQGALPDGIRSLQSSAALLRGTFGFEGIGPMRAAAARAAALEADPASPWHALAQAAYATGLYWSGDFDAAAAQAREASAVAPSSTLVRMLGAAILALIAVDRGELSDAQRWLRRAEQIVADAGPGLGVAPQSSLVFTAAGAIASRCGRLTEARNAFQCALDIRHGKRGISPWATLEALLRLAPVLDDLGDQRGAVTLLAEARSILLASPDGAEAQFDRLERFERGIAGQPRARPGALLTEREAAVLQLLRKPLSLRQIGDELYVSQNTVKTHTRAIYRKLGVSTRNDAVARGHDSKLFDAADRIPRTRRLWGWDRRGKPVDAQHERCSAEQPPRPGGDPLGHRHRLVLRHCREDREHRREPRITRCERLLDPFQAPLLAPAPSPAVPFPAVPSHTVQVRRRLVPLTPPARVISRPDQPTAVPQVSGRPVCAARKASRSADNATERLTARLE